ncbi:MAG: alpha-galactosidase [Kiritimatiellae bacterium]|nr:alpha-galactosidase [Kiritimatiellia bacterium]
MSEFRKVSYFERLIPVNLPESASFVYANANTMNHRLSNDGFYRNISSYNSEAISDDVIVVGDDASSKYVLVGAITAFRSLTHLSAVWRGRRLREVKVWQPEIKEGEQPEEIIILEGSDWRDLLCEYGERTAKAMKAIRPTGDANVMGYCSWYYYYKGVTEKDFLENVDTLAKLRTTSAFKARYVQIDDGYQTFQGDWNDQDASWPTPLAEIAKRITDGGMEAGIWTMPFHASTASRVFRDHPDWFVKGPDGKPLVAQGWSPPPDHLWATLDTTQDAVLEHLRNIFRTFREWGYTYFKMDGLGFALTDGVRADPNATSVSAFRKGLQAIREAVPDSFLLACSQHFLPCVGIVDGARFSDDTAANAWAISRAAEETLGRFWMFDRYYWADPDCLIVRTDRGTNTFGESRVSALTGILTGFALTSDNLALVPPERLALLEKAATIRMRGVRPAKGSLNIWRTPWPTSFVGTIDGRPAAAFLNLTDEPMEWKLAEVEGLGGCAAFKELLQGTDLSSGTLTLPPHDAALVVA